KSRPGKRTEGEVVEIIKRSRSEFVGRLELSTRYAFVVPDNRKMHYDIFVKLTSLKNAKHNDKVIVKITEWPGRDKNPSGEIINILGQAGDNEAEIHSIMAEFGLPFEFDPKVEEAAARISEEITEKEISNRRDMRDVFTITIDPEDAKDFDDAISLKHLENGNYEIGVHIADVAHYVKPDTILDEEAFNRATSVYLVDRTIPMLPEKLSNNLCSLRPHEDKLTFSAVFELDNNARLHKEWFGRTIIHSDRRFSYEEAQERIETQEGDYAKELLLLNQLALKLRVERFMKGSVNFETTEVKFKLDEKGKPLGVIPKVRKDAHKLIEDFMLLANKKVAEFVNNMKGGHGKEDGEGKSGKGKSGKTFVYRTHDYPDPEKLQTFSVFAQKFGHQLKTEEAAISKSLNALMDEIEGKPEQNVLQTLAIRTMAKAKYTTEAKGHFGLAFNHYTHFTSPIRRYPDVMVHRLLQHYLDKGKSVDKDNYEEKCVHSSEMEKRAADAERASIKYKQVEFMASVADKVFDGLVSGVTEWGIFVEIVETKCEGMVRMSDMDDDFYEFDEKNYRVIGKRNKKIITLGDKVQVTVKATDIDRRTIDLEFVNNERRTAGVHRSHKQRN
ncbi:MAG: ribonuclease R, partial [Bacteroidota bacterium]|nr:ribonuclease R [Bacteroidota bacterium]